MKMSKHNDELFKIMFSTIFCKMSNIGSYILFYIQNRPYDYKELVSVCVIPLCTSLTGQSPTIGSDTSPDSRVGICVPALRPLANKALILT